MSVMRSSGRLQRGQRKAAAVGRRNSASTTGDQQPVDGVDVMAQQILLRLFGAAIAARHESHDVTVRLQRHDHVGRATTGGGQQRHRGGVQYRRGLGADGHDVADTFDTYRAATQIGVLLSEPTRAVERVGEQHRLEVGMITTGELPQGLKQPLETPRIVLQPGDEARVRDHARIEHTGRCRDGGQPIADGMCQSAQQIVMNGEPAHNAGRSRGRRIVRLAVHH